MAFWENESDTLGNETIPIGLWMVMEVIVQNNNLYIGRTSCWGFSCNQYCHYGMFGPGIFIYNGVDGDNTNFLNLCSNGYHD